MVLAEKEIHADDMTQLGEAGFTSSQFHQVLIVYDKETEQLRVSFMDIDTRKMGQ